MKRVNVLYIIWIVAFIVFLFIMNNLRTQGNTTIFGIALSETYSLNVEFSTNVKERRVQQGDKVKKGDTLLILERSETDRELTDRNALINQLNVDRASKNQLLDKEIELFNARQNTRYTELQAQINITKKEIEIQENLLKSIGQSKAKTTVNLKQLELDALNESLRQLNIQTAQQQKSYETQRQSDEKYYEAKLAQYKGELGYYQKEYRMNVISPCDGIIENVFVLPNDFAPQYKELLRVNSFTPNKVTGFIHESVATPFKLGDSVTLISAARPDVLSRGIIVGTGNNLVELPIRLRKFVDIRAWGREVYLKMDPSNNFYLGEKILIQMD